MQRTRRWTHVAQEARRLAELGLTPLQIATRLDVNRSTVQRWMAAGKLRDTRWTAPDRSAVTVLPTDDTPQPATWGAAVRATFALDASDDELVRLGETALALAHDTTETTACRLTAIARFQGIVKQLRLIARQTDADPTPAAAPVESRKPVIPSTRLDPRNVLIQ